MTVITTGSAVDNDNGHTKYLALDKGQLHMYLNCSLVGHPNPLTFYLSSTDDNGYTQNLAIDEVSSAIMY